MGQAQPTKNKTDERLVPVLFSFLSLWVAPNYYQPIVNEWDALNQSALSAGPPLIWFAYTIGLTPCLFLGYFTEKDKPELLCISSYCA